jgi:hypothetical protein
MSREEEIAPIQNMLEGILSSTRLMGASHTSTCPRSDRRVPENQIFPKEQRHHQLPIGLGDPVKTESPNSTSDLQTPARG